jgi:hypothetical protein
MAGRRAGVDPFGDLGIAEPPVRLQQAQYFHVGFVEFSRMEESSIFDLNSENRSRQSIISRKPDKKEARSSERTFQRRFAKVVSRS